MSDLSGDAALKRSAMAGRAVPKKYLETPNRRWMKRMIRVMGLFSFVLTVLTIVSVFLSMLFPVLMNDNVMEAVAGTMAGLFFMNLMGLFIEMGADATGRNWFAKATGLMWLWVSGTFLIAILIEIAKSLF